jgi:hypothetical protein
VDVAVAEDVLARRGLHLHGRGEMLGAGEDFSKLPVPVAQDLRELFSVVVSQAVNGTRREIGTQLIPPLRAVRLGTDVAEQFPGQPGVVDDAQCRAEPDPVVLSHRRREPVAAHDEGIQNRGEPADRRR